MSPTYAPGFIVKVNGYEKIVHRLQGPSLASLKKSLLAIVAEATGVPELVSLKVGLATRLPLMMMRLILTS
jgi:hypothetical protein